MRIWRVGVLLLIFAGMLKAENGPPAAAPPEVQSSVQKCDEAVKQAEAVYRKAVFAAKVQLHKDIVAQIQVAMKAQKLEAAKALDAMRLELESEIRLLDPKGFVVRVEAKSWVKVGQVKAGQTYQFEARGRWSANILDPNGTCDADGLEKAKGGKGTTMALVARVNGKTTVVGKAATITFAEDGVLELGPNDGVMDDNSGFLMVRIDGVAH